MEKKTVNMKAWELYVYDEEFTLTGLVEMHPLYGTKGYIGCSSAPVGCVLDDDSLIYDTESVVYRCPLKYIVVYPYSNVAPDYKEKLTHRADTSDSDLDRIIAALAKLSLEHDREYGPSVWDRDDDIDYKSLNFSDDLLLKRIKELQCIGQKEIEEASALEDARLIEIAKKYEDCIYIEALLIGSGDKLAYHLGDETGIVLPQFHNGTFQDSVLYTRVAKKGSEEVSFDFRYFPKFFGMEMKTYRWSENIRNVVIKNKCKETIVFNNESIQPEEVKVFTIENQQSND